MNSKSSHKTTSPKTSRNRPKYMGYDRMDRIGDLIHQTLARLIALECKDPRIGLVTITSVEVSRDMAHARVFVTVLEESKVNETIKVLNQASSFLRVSLAQMIKLRVVPRLRFIFDESVLQGTRIENLLAEANLEGR